MYCLLNSAVLLLCTSIIINTVLSESYLRWPTPAEEALDEVHDAEYFNAVQKSMKEWNLKSQKSKRTKRAIRKVCYNEVGCFEDSGPFSYLEMLPSSPEEINTKFYFYSTKRRSEQPLLELPFVNMSAAMDKSQEQLNDNSTESTTQLPKYVYSLDEMTGFDELSVRVIVHGFGSACPHVWIYEMKTALMAVENCIVICVDWENGATLPNYVRAAANTRLVGKQLALLLQNLREHKGLDLTKTHIIGFSLGAHVAGFAGSELPGLKRITGLDPAGPLFESQDPKVRLDSSDADFVDVIHSNGENLILGGLGSWQPMGHVDFYPNGGRVQNGCSNLFVGAVTDFIWSQTAENEGRSLCNHRRAYKFFIDSVAPRCLFPAFSCNSYNEFLHGKCFPCKKDSNDIEDISRCGNMGYYADKSSGRGQLYLVTREEEPFCAHQFNLEIYNSFNDLPLRTIGKIEATLEGDGGLNETFLITDKEDAEFFAGDVVSKIIVPHPALGFPKSLTLQYKSYSGWLSRGLPHWDIDKVVLTDSFGRSHSICEPSLSLSSGIPVYMVLESGICELEDRYEVLTTTEGVDIEFSTYSIENLDSVDEVENAKNKKDILNLRPNYEVTGNQSYVLEEPDDSFSFSWKPMLEGNSLDREASESSRSLRDSTSEVFEPVLKEGRSIETRSRKMHTFDSPEVMEPILKTKSRQNQNLHDIPMNEEAKSNDGGFLTVQLFPFRLGEFLERAERYARKTLLPLISVQAPKLFGFGNEKETSERKPRYIPRYFNQIQNDSIKNIDHSIKSKINEAKDKSISSNIFEIARRSDGNINTSKPSLSKPIYYSNKIGKSWNWEADLTDTAIFDADNNTKIKIDLPTYQPPKISTKHEN